GLLASSLPNAPEAPDAYAVPVKDEQPITLRPALCEYLLQLGSETEGEHPGVSAFSLGRVKPHHLPFPIDLGPRETEHLGLSPAGHAQELNDGTHVGGQLKQQCREVAILKEACPGVAERGKLEYGSHGEELVFDRNAERRA